MVSKARGRKVKREGSKSLLFRGNRYWFYQDHFLKYRGKITADVRNTVSRLRKHGYRVRLVRPKLSWNIIEVYTSPKVPGEHNRLFDRIH